MRVLSPLRLLARLLSSGCWGERLACHADRAHARLKGYLSVSNGRGLRDIGFLLTFVGLNSFLVAGYIRLSQGINQFEFWLGVISQVVIGLGLSIMILSKKEN